MKMLFNLFIAAMLITTAACEKDKGDNCDLPATSVPAEVTGNWVNGYTSFTQVIDAYNGKILGNTWQSGRYLHLESNGRNAEMYIMGGSMYSEFVTKVQGTVSFNAANGTFQFNVCSAHYKGWSYGSLKVNRPATDSEKQQLTQNLQFYYGFEQSGGINYLQLRFEPNGSPTSFRKSN
jgi:hypothetical protein